MKLRLWYRCANCDVRIGEKSEQCVRQFPVGAGGMRQKKKGEGRGWATSFALRYRTGEGSSGVRIEEVLGMCEMNWHTLLHMLFYILKLKVVYQ